MKIRLVISLTLFLLAAAQTASVAGPSTAANTTSESTVNFTNLSYATVDQQVDAFSTELIAQTSSRNVVFDQTFDVAFSDPAVQAAVTQAESNLAGAGQSSFTGPTLTSNLNSVTGTSTNSVLTVTGTNVTATVTTYVGPQTIMVGDNQSQSLTIVAGGEDVDTLVTSTYFTVQTNTVTSTNLTTQIYEITGIPAPADLSLSATTVPESPVFTGSLLGYSLVVSNTSQSAVTNVVISNQIPASVTFVQATGSVTPTNGVLVLNLGTLAAGATNGVDIAVFPNVQGTLTNLFTVNSDELEPASATVLTLVTNLPAVTNDVLYRVVDLGDLGDSNSIAYAINNSDQIAGEASLLGGNGHAAYWTNILTPPINLGSTNVGLGSEALDINNPGQIVGDFNEPAFSSHACYWTNSASPPLDLGTLGGVFSEALSINDSGQIVGDSNPLGGGGSYACYWTNSASPAFDLGTLGGEAVAGNNSQANSINSAGQIVGYAVAASGEQHAAFWTNNSSPAFQINDAGTTNNSAKSINNLGQIVGDNTYGAVYWTNFTSLPYVLSLVPNYGAAGVPTCINNHSQIVGYNFITNNLKSYIPEVATIWMTPSSTAQDLNTLIPTNSGWLLFQAFGINDSGVIVGVGAVTNANGPHGYIEHAFALVPLNLPTNADLSLKASGIFVPTGVTGDSNLVYTLTVSNAGPATATGVVISNQYPAAFTFDSASVMASTNNDILMLTLGSLAAGATDQVQVVMSPGLEGDNGTYKATNVFAVSAAEHDPDLTNNTATVVSSVDFFVEDFTTSTRFEETNLTANVKQTATNFTTELIARLANGTVAYEMTFSNAFTDPAVQAAVTTAAGDLSGDGDSSYTGPTETSFSKTFEDKTSVTVTNPIGTNITVTVTTYVGPTNIFVGNNQTNSLQLTAGHTDIDTLVTDDLTNLLTTTVTSNYLNSAVYVMTGIVAQASADLSLSGTSVLVPATSGTFTYTNVVYSLTVSNAGPSTATGVVISNEVPAAVAFVSATGGALPTNGVLLVNLGSLAVGATNLIQIVVTPDNLMFTLTNVFQVSADQPDPNPTNNSVTVTNQINNSYVTVFTTSTLLLQTNLTANAKQTATNYTTELIAKLANGTVAYEMTFSNAFSDPAVQAAVTTAAGDLSGDGDSSYTGPTETSFQKTFEDKTSATATNLIGSNVTATVTEYVGPTNIFVGNERTNLLVLPAGAADYDTLVVVDLTNLLTTTVTSNYLNSAVYVMTGMVASADVDVALSVMAAPEPVDVGDPLTYSLTVTNNSTNTATGVVVTDTLPASVIFNSVLPSQGSATNHSGVVTYNVGSLPNGTAATLALVVVPTAAGELTNYAIAYSVQTDSQPANNSATNVTTAVSVAITNLVLTVLTDITLNPQTGLYEQQIEVSNGGPATPSSVLVLISGLAANATVYNASGSSNGVPYVQSMSPLGVGSNVIFTVEYYVPTRVTPVNLAFTVVAGPAVTPPVVAGTILSISQAVILDGGDVLVEFSATPGRIYAIQYSSDMVTWRTAVPAIKAPGTQVQWIDSGPPKTDSSPAGQGARYYRVVLLN